MGLELTYNIEETCFQYFLETIFKKYIFVKNDKDVYLT